MKLQMKREALVKLNRRANEMSPVVADALLAAPMCTVTVQYPVRAQFVHSRMVRIRSKLGKCFRINCALHVGA